MTFFVSMVAKRNYFINIKVKKDDEVIRKDQNDVHSVNQTIRYAKYDFMILLRIHSKKNEESFPIMSGNRKQK